MHSQLEVFEKKDYLFFPQTHLGWAFYKWENFGGPAGVPQDVMSHMGRIVCLIYLWQVNKEKTTGSMASLNWQLDSVMRKFRIDQDFLIEHWHMIYTGI